MFMEQTGFSLIYFKENFGGFLSPNDVRLFYYDICFEKETKNIQNRNAFIYEWNEEIQSYLSSKNIIIDAIDNNVMPQSFEKNKIYFTMRRSDEGNVICEILFHII